MLLFRDRTRSEIRSIVGRYAIVRTKRDRSTQESLILRVQRSRVPSLGSYQADDLRG